MAIDTLTSPITPNDLVNKVNEVIEEIPTKTSELTNDSGFITDAGVTSFNGSTGAVTYTAPVTSVNGDTGDVTVAVPTKTSDLTNDSGFTTNAGTVTSVAMGAGLSGGTITESGTISAALQDDTPSTLTATAMGSTANRQYAVGLDANGDLSVNVPWTDNTSALQYTIDGTNESVVMGDVANNVASGQYSVAEGQETTATRDYQTVIGKYNALDSNDDSTDAAFVIGGGDSTTRKDIFTVDWNGNATADGNIKGDNIISKGSVTQGVYFDANGVAQPMTYTVEKSVPSNAVFTDTKYNFSGTTFYSGRQDTAEHDANNAIKNGHYYYSSNGPDASIGASSTDGALYVQQYSDSWVGQIAQDYRNGALFVRGKNNGTWQAWSKLIRDCIEIPKNSNLNSYNQTGYFYTHLSANAATMTNCPTSNAFLLKVFRYPPSSGGMVHQECIEYMTSGFKVWHRNYYNSTWGSWIEWKLTDTNTWRGIQNNLTSDSTTESLSAAQGKALNGAKVAKAGDTMTGSLTFDKVTNAIQYQGTKATYAMIKFKDNTADTYGNGIGIGGGGLTVIGGGESTDAVLGSISTGGSEQLVLCNDGAIDIWTNCQNGASSATKRTIDTSGNFSGNAANVTGTVAIAHGGTGLTSSPSMLTNLDSTTAANVLQASPRPGITGTLAIGHGGTGLTASPSMLTNLGSTTAANVLQASPRPGITGTLAVGHGGTGHTGVGTKTLSNTNFSSLAINYWGKVCELSFATTARTTNLSITGLIPAGYRPSSYGIVITAIGHVSGAVKGYARVVVDGSGNFYLQVANSTSQTYQGSVFYLQYN